MGLENLAIDWVKRCEFAHPDTGKFPQYKGTGQNIAVSGGTPRNVTNMATMWYNEVEYYDFATHTCQAGKMCGHYTQVSE